MPTPLVITNTSRSPNNLIFASSAVLTVGIEALLLSVEEAFVLRTRQKAINTMIERRQPQPCLLDAAIRLLETGR